MSEHARRGPKRNEQTRLAILEATAERFRSVGYDHLTIEGVAADAGVAKQTIYRWWASKSALVAECLGERMLLTELFVPEDSGDLRADVTAWLENIVAFLRSDGNAGLLRSLIAAASENPEVTARLSDRLGVWPMLGERFQHAVGAGTLPSSVPVDEIADALFGALVLRDLRGAPIDDGFAERLTRLVLPPVGQIACAGPDAGDEKSPSPGSEDPW